MTEEQICEQKLCERFEKEVVGILSKTAGLVYKVTGYFNFDGQVIRPLVAFEFVVEDKLPEGLLEGFSRIIDDDNYGLICKSLKLPVTNRAVGLHLAESWITARTYIALYKKPISKEEEIEDVCSSSQT